MTKRKRRSLWDNYWEHECEIHQYTLGTDTDRVLGIIDTDINVEKRERDEVLRLLGFDPESETVWIGVSKKSITLMGRLHFDGFIFAGDGKEPHSRFAVIDGLQRRDK